MKYQGLVELSVRQYLGILDGMPTWKHVKYAIGIIKENKVYDYKTLEEYNYLPRNEKGEINALGKKIVIGNTYAIDTNYKKFEINKKYSEKEINRYILESNSYSLEYKTSKAKCKTLKK